MLCLSSLSTSQFFFFNKLIDFSFGKAIFFSFVVCGV